MKSDNFNLPPKVRFGIYVFFGVGSIVVTFLADMSLVGPEFVKAWVSLTVFGSGLAAINVAK